MYTKEQLLNDPELIINTKKQFERGMYPVYHGAAGYLGDYGSARLPLRRTLKIPQDVFLDEYDTYSHMINSPFTLDDKKVITLYKDANGNEQERTSYVPVTRLTFPLQKIIALKQLTHLTGNGLNLTLTNTDQTDEDKLNFVKIKQQWTSKNMDVALFKSVQSQLITGDGALLMYWDENKQLDWHVYSWKDGYCLLPSYDEYGKLILFSLYYTEPLGDKAVTRLDVWDETYAYKYESADSSWKQISKEQHGFKMVPFCYRMGDVAWNDVQQLIEQLELHASIWAESERYYIDPILFLKGEVDILPKRDTGGKAIQGTDENSDAKLLQQDESKNIINLTDFLLKEIFRGSCTISFSPQDVKTSGDLPGITVKLLFSAAVEKAISAAKEWDDFVDRMVSLFIYAIGIEERLPANFNRLKIRGEIIPYIPQNTTELINQINTSKQAETISQETAAELNPLSAADEYMRLKEQTPPVNKTPVNDPQVPPVDIKTVDPVIKK